jgi:hypothetical protein
LSDALAALEFLSGADILSAIRLHPNEVGYQIWAEAIEPKAAELMGEKPKE